MISPAQVLNAWKWNRLKVGIFLCVMTFTSVVPSEPLYAQNFASGRSFWNPPSSTSSCRTSYQNIGNFELSKSLVRRPYPNDYGRNFTANYGMWLIDTIAGRKVSAHKQRILSIAGGQYFTKAVHSGGWSPIYIQSTTIKLTAMYIRVMEARGLLTQSERNILLSWGDKMIPGQKGTKGNGSSDSRLASGIAMIAWGNVKGDTRLMKAGYRKFMSGYPYVLSSVGKLKRHPGHRGIPISALSLEDEYNVALMHAVEGAAMLRNLGIDVASVQKGGTNLHEAVSWWAGVVASKPPGFKGYKAWNHNFNQGWIPIYLSAFPNQPHAAKLNKISRDVTRGRTPSFRAISLGGATKCLW